MATHAFCNMAQALQQAAPPLRRPPLNDDEASTAWLMAHFGEHDDWPFPAGPMHPRPQAEAGPAAGLLGIPGPQGVQRAAACMLALSKLPGTVGQLQGEVFKRASAYTGLVRNGISDWATWRGLPPDNIHDLVLKAIETLASETSALCDGELESEVEAHNAALQRRITTHIRNHRVDEGACLGPGNTSPDASAFAYPAWQPAGRMGADPAKGLLLDHRPPVSEGEVAAVKAALAQALGEWALLAALFIKLLHGHLAHVSSRSGAPAAAAAVLAKVVGRVLAAAASRPGHPLAPVAAGIARVLRQAGDGPVEALLPPGLPACFNTALLHSPPAMLIQARLLLGRANLNGSPLFEAWADETACLADETASLLTDPMLAASLGLAAQDFDALAQHQLSWKKGGEAGRLPAKAPEIDHRRLALLPRLERLFRYHQWMHQHGLPALAWAVSTLQAAGDLPPLPTLAASQPAARGHLGNPTP